MPVIASMDVTVVPTYSGAVVTTATIASNIQPPATVMVVTLDTIKTSTASFTDATGAKP